MFQCMDEPHCVCPSPVDGHLDVPTSDARDAEQLSKNKVTHILSVHDSARPTLEGVKYLCIPAADSPSQNLTRHFKESIQFIHECRLRGEGCLVHCLAGVSRSVTLVVAYIMTVTDFGWEDALRTVRAGRSCANPNLGFQRQLQEFEERQVHQFRQWLKEEYGESPLRDAEEARGILGKYKEQGRTEPPPGAGRWGGLPASPPPAYGSCTTET
ncbi:dual specificity protein phosphatase 22 isoform X4 [Eubalaena glacialis]|uniref:dual specificity protein phosphatase 22 isoform X4 n=1 Tax=Eubalaena glacialis TaxID=27606 RepID=UPI002A5AF96F|nr:dual specificity protein phosphatase 22 isoform X4 [Eubalaena glacialis]